MIWAVYAAMVLACGVLVMMRREIISGFSRTSDYLIVTPLLFGAGAGQFFLAQVLSDTLAAWPIMQFFVKALLGFGIMVVVWGGTLTLGALIMRLLTVTIRARA